MILLEVSITLPSVLVVDDVVENVQVLTGILQDQYSVKAALNGRTALKIAEKTLPDLILLDIMMPEMDGYQVCTQLKKNPLTQQIPVIFVTTKDQELDEAKGFEVGAVDYINKPINPLITKARIKTHISLSHQKQTLETYSQELELRNQELENIYHFLHGEMDKTMRLHKRTFPEVLPHRDGLFLAAYYQPAQKMGGDYYNVIELEKRVILYLSDVTGHGLEGAYLSLFVRDTINSYLHFTPEERITVSGIMEFLARQYRKERWPDDYFVCIYIGILERESMELSYLGAGFQTNPLLSIGESKLVELHNSGLPISTAIPHNALNFQQKKIQLKPTWTLLFNTDGLTEYVVQNTSYEERVRETFLKNSHRPPREIVEMIKEDFRDFNHGSLQGDDDITFLVIQINEE